MKDIRKETVFYNRHEGDITVANTYDVSPILEKAKQLRDAGATDFGESKVAGVIPMFVVSEWMKEAGVRMDDNEARKEIIRKKMLSGEFDRFRVWEGTF
jgi:hypothetical protein